MYHCLHSKQCPRSWVQLHLPIYRIENSLNKWSLSHDALLRDFIGIYHIRACPLSFGSIFWKEFLILHGNFYGIYFLVINAELWKATECHDLGLIYILGNLQRPAFLRYLSFFSCQIYVMHVLCGWAIIWVIVKAIY